MTYLLHRGMLILKRLIYFALFITILFLCMPIMGISSHAQTVGSVVSPSDAEPETEGETGSQLADTAPTEITEIAVNKFTVNRIHLLKQGASSASLDLPQLNGTIQFYREGADFAEKDVRYFVNYETGDFDCTYGNQTGLFFLKASIILEDERYVMAPEVSAFVSLPIFLYDPEQPTFLPPLNPKLNKHDAMETFHIVTDVHTDLQQVNAMLHNDFPYQRFYVYFEGGYYLNLPNVWDLNAVEAGIPGIYPAYRRPELPQGVLMADIPEAVCSINIQSSEAFTLSSPVSFGNNIVVRWLYPTPEPSLFRLRYRIGNGDWILDNDEYFMRLHSDENGKLSLYLNPWEMEKDIHYQFQLEYDSVYSNIFNLCVNEDGFYIPNEGDEDGGDRDNQTPPDVIQPPQNSSEPENRSDDSVAAASGQTAASETPSFPKSSAAAEADTSTSATWSGRRILQYLKISPGLPLIFEKDLIRVTIPANSPALLNLSDSDSLHVEIQVLSANTLRLTASLNEVPITEIPMTITMPWGAADKTEDLQVKKKDSEWIGKIAELNTDGTITFTVTQSGVYTILPSAPEDSASEEERKEDTLPALEPEITSRPAATNVLSAIGILSILILGSISIIAFLYYKRRKG